MPLLEKKITIKTSQYKSKNTRELNLLLNQYYKQVTTKLGAMDGGKKLTKKKQEFFGQYLNKDFYSLTYFIVS